MDMKKIKRTIAGLSALAVMLSGGVGIVPESAVNLSITANATEIVDESEIFSVTRLPYKTIYKIGEELDLTGAQYTADYFCKKQDGATFKDIVNFAPVEERIEDGSITVDASEFDNTRDGTYTITLIYHGNTGDLTATFEVVVTENTGVAYIEGSFEDLTYRNYGDHVEIINCDKSASQVIVPPMIGDAPVTVICEEAFMNCTELEWIFFYDTLKTIETDAFFGCEKLDAVWYSGDWNAWKNIEVDNIGNDKMQRAGALTDTTPDDVLSTRISIKIANPPTKAEYRIGEELDLTGARFNINHKRTAIIGLLTEIDYFESDLAYYVNNGTLTIDDSEFDNTKPGTYKIYVQYGKPKNFFEVTVKEGAPAVPLGDLDGNDAINATDAAMVLSAAAAVGAGVDSGLTEEQMKAADVDGNGSFDASDASYILAYAAYTGAGGADSLDEFLDSRIERPEPTEPTEPDNPIVAQLCYENKGGYIEITGCQTNDITELVIPAEIDGVPVKSIANEAFQQYTDLVSVSIADGVTSIGDFAFWGCSGLTSVTLPDSIENIGKAAFSNSDSLESIHVSENSKFFKSVDGVLFSKDGTALLAFPMAKTCTSYIIPDGVTTVGDYAFFSCKNLNAVIIPTTVKSVETRAFDCCVNLTAIYYTGTEEEWKEIVIANEDEDEDPPAPVIHYNYVSEIS